MIIVLCCAVMVAAGVAIVVRWGGMPRRPGAAMTWPNWLARWAGVALVSGVVAGILAGGAGGRLVMRLLAITSPGAARQVTEAGAVVGEISLGGTLGLFVFVGVAGLVSGLLYLAVGPLLPDGRLRGVLFGLLLLLLLSTRLDPLRGDNFDFNLVGPPWLAVASFVVLVLFDGMLIAALERRLSRAWLPGHPPALAPRARVAGRAAAGAAALVALPSFVAAISDIL